MFRQVLGYARAGRTQAAAPINPSYRSVEKVAAVNIMEESLPVKIEYWLQFNSFRRERY